MGMEESERRGREGKARKGGQVACWRASTNVALAPTLKPALRRTILTSPPNLPALNPARPKAKLVERHILCDHPHILW